MLSGTMVNSSLQNPGGASPEQQLIRRVQDGERELFYELVRPYERRVYTAAFAILRNEADAEDAAQEALLKAFKHIRQYCRICLNAFSSASWAASSASASLRKIANA